MDTNCFEHKLLVSVANGTRPFGILNNRDTYSHRYTPAPAHYYFASGVFFSGYQARWNFYFDFSSQSYIRGEGVGIRPWRPLVHMLLLHWG